MAAVISTSPLREAILHGPEPVALEGCRGWRYWVDHPLEMTGCPAVDAWLAGYPVVVFLPTGRPAEQTPVALCLQGMAAPYSWNGFLVPTLLELGIACILFDTPGAGERSVSRSHDGDVMTELTEMARHGAVMTVAAIARLFEGVARDHRTVLRLAAERHGLIDPRRALFGVSLGALLSAYSFLRYRVGVRLLGAVGHADLARFARSYMPSLGPILATLPVDLFGAFFPWAVGPRSVAGLGFLEVLRNLSCRSACEANPLRYLSRDDARPVRFLVGGADPLVRAADAQRCAARFANGACHVVPELGHGGDGFSEHVCRFLIAQLADWRRPPAA